MNSRPFHLVDALGQAQKESRFLHPTQSVPIGISIPFTNVYHRTEIKRALGPDAYASNIPIF